MFKQTALITWQPNTAAAARKALIVRAQAAVAGAALSHTAPTVPGSHQGGDDVWHLHFPDEAAWKQSGAQTALDLLAADTMVENLDAVAYDIQRHGLTETALTNGIYRTLFTSLGDAAPAADVAAFCDDLAAMQAYIPEIINWAINPVHFSRGRRKWTHVWEQEFTDINGLLGPYMTNPYHWAYVDRWFDAEMPCKIVDAMLCHSASVLETSVMAHY
jgi:hypothetical protein